MKIRLIRHATVFLEFMGRKILVDPCLSDKGSIDYIKNPQKNTLKNPLIDLPINEQELSDLIESVDYVLITHLHKDHFSGFEKYSGLYEKTIIAQAEDRKKLYQMGFHNVNGIHKEVEIDGINYLRTSTRHGGVIVRKLMGKNSGFLLKGDGENTLYIAGDTLWSSQVKSIIQQYKPSNILLYGGSAQIAIGKPITMSSKDIKRVLDLTKTSLIFPVHMEAFNHCQETREQLNKSLENHPDKNRVIILKDGHSREV